MSIHWKNTNLPETSDGIWCPDHLFQTILPCASERPLSEYFPATKPPLMGRKPSAKDRWRISNGCIRRMQCGVMQTMTTPWSMVYWIAAKLYLWDGWPSQISNSRASGDAFENSTNFFNQIKKVSLSIHPFGGAPTAYGMCCLSLRYLLAFSGINEQWLHMFSISTDAHLHREQLTSLSGCKCWENHGTNLILQFHFWKDAECYSLLPIHTVFSKFFGYTVQTICHHLRKISTLWFFRVIKHWCEESLSWKQKNYINNSSLNNYLTYITFLNCESQ